MSYGRMKQREPQLAAQIEEMLAKAEAADASEDAENGQARGDEMPDWVQNKQRQLEKIREAKAALEAQAQAEAQRLEAERAAQQEATGKAPKGRRPKALDGVPEDKAQRNFTDPESRIMKTADGYVQGYNAQAAVDAQSGVIVDQAVSATQNDVGELVPSMERIEAGLGKLPREVSADAGYFSEGNAEAMEQSGVRAYIATGRQKHHKKSADDAGEEPDRRKGPQAKAMRARLRRGGHRSRYRLRKQTVEPVFGQIKEARGFRRFLLRGVANVQAEWALVCTAHNILKLYNAGAARRAS
jgi:IS5 family transposase